jgi:uncharacterized iron-regulated membrane protein
MRKIPSASAFIALFQAITSPGKARVNLKKLAGRLHLWLGLGAGAIVFIISVAAALFVFEKELTGLFHRHAVLIEPDGRPNLPLSALLPKARAAVPGEVVQSVDIERGNRAYVFTTWKEAAGGRGFTFWSEYDYWKDIYVDPRSGEVLGIIDQLRNPIRLFRVLHQQLLLRYEIGHQIVAAATLIFFLMILSGLVLWWPRNKAALKQALRIKPRSGKRRFNYDLHRVGGFYAYLFILLLGATGLVWSYRWWTNGIYRLLGDDPATVFKDDQPASIPAGKPASQDPLDIALADIMGRRPEWTSLSLSLPGAWSGESKDIAGYLSFNSGSLWDESDAYHYHPLSGALYHSTRQESRSLGEKWRTSNYGIHVGTIYGWPTKILAFLVASFAASLPVTGFLIWRGRRRKNGRRPTGGAASGAEIGNALEKAVRPASSFPIMDL